MSKLAQAIRNLRKTPIIPAEVAPVSPPLRPLGKPLAEPSQEKQTTAPTKESKTIETYLALSDRFILDNPNRLNAFALQKDAWKFDFDKISAVDLKARISALTAPQACAKTFGPIKNFDILELGPSDGYYSAALEAHNPKSITSIEGNVGAFMRCLILKNELNLRAKFLLGDFLKYIELQEVRTDLLFASGILYHLKDPAAFLKRAGEISKHIFMWTFIYDEDVIANHPYEKHWFAKDENTNRELFGRSFTYHKRYYQKEIVEGLKFAGGLHPYSYWLTESDLLTLLDLSGFDVKINFPNEYSGIPARSILASVRS